LVRQLHGLDIWDSAYAARYAHLAHHFPNTTRDVPKPEYQQATMASTSFLHQVAPPLPTPTYSYQTMTMQPPPLTPYTYQAPPLHPPQAKESFFLCHPSSHSQSIQRRHARDDHTNTYTHSIPFHTASVAHKSALRAQQQGSHLQMAKLLI